MTLVNAPRTEAEYDALRGYYGQAVSIGSKAALLQAYNLGVRLEAYNAGYRGLTTIQQALPTFGQVWSGEAPVQHVKPPQQSTASASIGLVALAALFLLGSRK